jgi:hypothetical protein
MKMRLGPVGPRGLMLLAAVGVVGLVLAAHGWAHRATGGPLGSLGGAPASAPASPAATSGTSDATTPPPAGPSAPGGAATHASAPGPLLTSQPFAQYSFVIWPGAQSTAAKTALTGLSFSVRQQPAGLSITAAVNGQKAGPAQFYPKGARVYVVEATMGDDSGNADYNVGDDGIVVTDASGRIVP